MQTDNTEVTPDRLHDLYPHERKHMRFDPTVNMGHIISMGTSIITMLVVVMASWSTLDKRIVVLEEARITQQQINRDRADAVNEKFSDLKGSLTELKVSVESLRRDLQEKRKDK